MNKRNIFLLQFSGIFIFLFLCCPVFSQQAMNASVVEKLKSYSSKAVQEKLFLHTDKEFYVAGEILWFKIYYTDGAFHQPMELSKVAYAEILNEMNEVVLQEKIALQPGKGKGSFYLPVTLTTGNYSLRAYTRWMKNFDEGYFFEKKITIVNTLKNPEPSAAKDTFQASVDFFPEGGNLVAGIQSKVGFKVTGSRGSIDNFHGYIIDKNGDTTTSFTPLKFGMGNFDFTPVAGNNYKAIVVLADSTSIKKTLPEIFNYGYVMRVVENNTGQITIIVKRKRIPTEQNADQILLVTHTRQMPGVAEKKSLNSGDSAVFLIDKNRIGKGITQFTIFNGNDKPVCERLFFIKPSPVISLQVKSDRDLYDNREPISLSLNAQYNSGNTIPLN